MVLHSLQIPSFIFVKHDKDKLLLGCLTPAVTIFSGGSVSMFVVMEYYNYNYIHNTISNLLFSQQDLDIPEGGKLNTVPVKNGDCKFT